MSWMKGDLLSKTRRLAGGLATREPVWLKAMEASPPPVFPRSNGKIQRIVLPEDSYVRKFTRKHLQAKLDDPNKASAFVPDPARVYGCRVLQLTENGISEDDAMSVANMEYLSERKEKKKAYKRLKELAELQDKSPPPKPYASAKKDLQIQETKPAKSVETPSVRRLVNLLKKQKDVLLMDKTGASANQDHWIDE
uniref:Small ribosomal subunit protein mS23 n=1 Tax=Noccaea caerulescens TaxID=107243 RepID=A0A1J3F1J0_NOCCA